MNVNKSSISQADSYARMGEFWDNADLTDYWEETMEVEFEVDIQSQKTLFRVENDLSLRMSEIARRRGISTETLLNIWIERNVSAETHGK